MLFTDEVRNINELVEKLKEFNFQDKLKVAVVCFVFDQDNKLILQKRGSGARDDVGKLSAIGGSANFSDPSFRDSLKRELIEESGSKANIEITEFIGALSKHGFDKNALVFNDWIILAYKGILMSGELVNMEPDRCDGFVTNYMEDFNQDELADTAKRVVNYLLNNK